MSMDKTNIKSYMINFCDKHPLRNFQRKHTSYLNEEYELLVRSRLFITAITADPVNKTLVKNMLEFIIATQISKNIFMYSFILCWDFTQY